MKTKTNTLQLNLHGVDMASAIIQEWLESVGIERKDILRIRLTMEEMLIAICENGDGKVEAELRFSKRKGDWWLRSREPGTTHRYVQFVKKDGSMGYSTMPDGQRKGIRPAMWVEVSWLFGDQ